MTATRSAAVARGQVTSPPGSAVIYTVPDGSTLIVKTVYLFNNSAAAARCFLDIRSAAGGFARLFDQDVDAYKPFAWEGWVVAEPTDTIELATASALLEYWVSGALLPG